jgi:RHS repeat-associated protein
VGQLGHTTEDETGLEYMRARYYDPAVGRFISEDRPGHGKNRYAYCGDDPIVHVDRSGHGILGWIANAVSDGWSWLCDTASNAASGAADFLNWLIGGADSPVPLRPAPASPALPIPGGNTTLIGSGGIDASNCPTLTSASAVDLGNEVTLELEMDATTAGELGAMGDED